MSQRIDVDDTTVRAPSTSSPEQTGPGSQIHGVAKHETMHVGGRQNV